MLNEVEVVSKRIFINIAFSTTPTSLTAFLPQNNDHQYKVRRATARFGTASSSGTLQVEVAGAAIAKGSGVNQLAGTLDLAGTADTNVSSETIGNPTAFGKGSALNVILGGTLTSLAGAFVSIELERLV